jgi:hypothetical protein
MKYKASLAILAAAGFGVGTAHALDSVEPLFNSFPNPTLISDNSAEYWIDVNGSTTVDVGDILFGIVGYNDIEGTPIGGVSSYNEFTGIQANKISSGPSNQFVNTQGVTMATYDAVPLTAADAAYFDWSTGTIDTNGAAAGGTTYSFNTALGASNDGKNFILLFEDGNQNYTRDGTVQQGLTTATDTGGTNSGARMLVTIDPTVDTNDIIRVTAAVNPFEPASLPTPVPPATSLQGSSLFLDGTVAAQNWPTITLGPQITAGNGGFSTPSTSTLNSGDPWPIFDNQDTTVFAEQRVPEPSSIALLAAGLIGGGFASRRRQRRQ